MNLELFIQQFLSISLAGTVTVSLAYLLFKKNLNKPPQIREKVIKVKENKQLLSLKLQAHERLIVFIERINPTNLLVRLHQNGIPMRDFQAIISNEIRAEYQHNITQQLYISTEAWNVIKKLKDDTLTMVNSAVQGLDENATGVDLSKKILQNMANIKNSPYELTIDLLKQSIHQKN
ncbi:MAG: hypothetical protein K2Q03_09655 [Sphingobacteriaceae bacterium]|nr:hypothetical protein [Sphingobacteriaceae bacterium]